MKQLHFAWFGIAGPGYWQSPTASLYDWRKPDLYMDIARMCERAKFDMALFADTASIPSLFRGSIDYYVRHGAKINPDPVPIMTMMGAVTKLLQYTQSERALTLRDIAKHEAMHETFPICGTPEHVADVLEHAAQVGGADGFHFRGAFGDLAYLTEVTTRLMPVLQRRGLARKEYSGQTLRNHLFEF